MTILGRRGPEAYIRGRNGLSAELTARWAAAVDRKWGLQALREDIGRGDPELDEMCLALQIIAAQHLTVVVPGRLARAASDRGTATGSADGTSRDSGPSATPALPVAPALSSQEAADLLGITQRAVTRAVARGALTGHRVGRTWALERDAVEAYRIRTRRT